MAEVAKIDIDGIEWDIRDDILTARFEQFLQSLETRLFNAVQTVGEIYNTSEFGDTSKRPYRQVPFTIKAASKKKVCIAQGYIRAGVGVAVTLNIDLKNTNTIRIAWGDSGTSFSAYLDGTYDAINDTWICTNMRGEADTINCLQFLGNA